MSELKVKGTIKSISAINDAGAGKKLTFKLDVDDSYNDFLEFEMYKKSEYFAHLDNFVKFNKVGDLVEVEFNLKSKAWTNPTTNIEKTFTSLSAWRIDKVDSETPPQSQASVMPEPTEDENPLPF